MASTYSTLKVELIGTGEQTGTWGTTTNDNLSIALGEAITGSADVAFSSSDVTVTLTDSNGAQTARNLRLNLTGTSGGARNLILGSGCQIEKLYLINNGLADAVTVKNTGGTGIAVPAGKTMFVFNNGTNVVDAVTHLSSLTLGTALPVVSGGTGVTTSTGTGNVVLSTSPTFTGAPIAPTAAPGTNTTQIATTAFVLASGIPSGVILLWSGSIGTIPAGFVLCDGTNSTPDLRNRFIVGAGSTYAVNETGGSANATLPSHTHTATSSVVDSGHQHGAGTFTGLNSPGGNGYPAGSNGAPTATPTATTGITVTTTNSTEGSSATNANLPPYFALAYIMKS